MIQYTGPKSRVALSARIATLSKTNDITVEHYLLVTQFYTRDSMMPLSGEMSIFDAHVWLDGYINGVASARDQAQTTVFRSFDEGVSHGIKEVVNRIK